MKSRSRINNLCLLTFPISHHCQDIIAIIATLQFRYCRSKTTRRDADYTIMKFSACGLSRTSFVGLICNLWQTKCLTPSNSNQPTNQPIWVTLSKWRHAIHRAANSIILARRRRDLWSRDGRNKCSERNLMVLQWCRGNVVDVPRLWRTRSSPSK